MTNLIRKVSPGNPGSGSSMYRHWKWEMIQNSQIFSRFKKTLEINFVHHNWKLESKQLHEVLFLFAELYWALSLHRHFKQWLGGQAMELSQTLHALQAFSQTLFYQLLKQGWTSLAEQTHPYSRTFESKAWSRSCCQGLVSAMLYCRCFQQKKQEMLAQSLSWHILNELEAKENPK